MKMESKIIRLGRKTFKLRRQKYEEKKNLIQFDKY